jgi:hypothetical protein
MQDKLKRAVLDAIVSVASLKVLERVCDRSNSAHSARSLAERCWRDVGEVREALELFERAGIVRGEVADNGEMLYSLSSAAVVWQFAQAFAQHFGQDSEYSQCFIEALVRNTGRRAGNQAAA